MYSLKQLKSQKGFTIVELLIVIVVIGILATLVIVTFSGIQRKARDTQRQTDINAVQGHLEAYYAEEGTYPALSMMQDSAWRTAHMKGLDPDALTAPDGTAMDDATQPTNGYRYQATAAAAPCTVTGTGADAVADCDAYVLTADLEGGDNYVKQSN